MKIKINECPYCQEACIKLIQEKEIEPYNICTHCHKTFPTHVRFISSERKVQQDLKKKTDSKFKRDKIIETYLDLAETIQHAGGSISVIKDHRDRPLSEFLEEICSTNNIRFKHNKKEM